MGSALQTHSGTTEKASITLDLDGLIKANRLDSDGWSTAEFAAEFGRSSSWANNEIKRLIESGEVKHAGFRLSLNITGKRCRTPVFTRTKPTRKKNIEKALTR